MAKLLEQEQNFILREPSESVTRRTSAEVWRKYSHVQLPTVIVGGKKACRALRLKCC